LSYRQRDLTAVWGGRLVSSGRGSFEVPYSAVLSTSVAVACAVGALILLMVPLPALVVDLLLAANLAGATGLLLLAILTPRPPWCLPCFSNLLERGR